MASNAVVNAPQQEAPKTTEQPTEKKAKAPTKAAAAKTPKAAKKAAPKNGLSEAERKRDMTEAAAEAKRPTAKLIARLNRLIRRTQPEIP